MLSNAYIWENVKTVDFMKLSISMSWYIIIVF